MIKHSNKILYIGAGCHIKPVADFPLTKQFVFIDTQPRSEYDSYHPTFDNEFYRHTFVHNLIEKCKHYKFYLESYEILDKTYYKQIISSTWYYTSWFYKIPPFVNPTMLVFINKKTQQHLTYYISTNIKFNMNKYLQNDIASCDGIIVSGYLPEVIILPYFVKPKALFCYTNTNYEITDIDDDNDNTIITFLHTSICNTPYYFTDFYMICDDTGIKIKCQDFNNFLSCIKDYHNQNQQEFVNNDCNINSINALQVNDE